MEQTRHVMMLIPCEHHSDLVAGALDDAGDWVILPTTQGRRMGLLEYRPPEHERSCDVILGMTDAPGVAEILHTLSEAIRGKALCPNCLAYVWEANQVLLANVAVDPVCRMAVNRDQGITATHSGVSHHFCSYECRNRFLEDPAAFVRSAASTARSS
jgi:YHS domain-containing protein